MLSLNILRESILLINALKNRNKTIVLQGLLHMPHFYPIPTPIDFELPELFTNPFDYEPSEVVRCAASELVRYLDSRPELHDELAEGKMFGVLVVRTPDGTLGALYGFSGNLAGQTTHDFFVPPIFDLHASTSFFRGKEAEISAINSQIKEIEEGAEMLQAKSRLDEYKALTTSQITEYKEVMRDSKRKRNELRRTTSAPELLSQLIAESQFQKAELKRMETKCNLDIAELEDSLSLLTDRVKELKAQRQTLSRRLQTEIFDSYIVLNHRGESQTLTDIFRLSRNAPPPAGAGECAAPKLLNYAFAHGLQPIAMGEFWWGLSPKGEVRTHGEYYTACKSKCEPILGYMLRGMELLRNTRDYSPKRKIEVLYEDEWLAVVDKPAGMLSVKGRTDQPSVESLLPQLFPHSPHAKVVHRLDMDTSGILLIALTDSTYSDLQRQFAQRTLTKEYIAIMEGEVTQEQGEILLPLAPDFENRPRQRVDHISGKSAHTSYRVLERVDGHSRLSLTPHTGRTHQLRMHCAHTEGLAMPIVGDRLYGRASTRLMLQAVKISFTHPTTLKCMTFEVKPEF